jgi:hypothetical protein
LSDDHWSVEPKDDNRLLASALMAARILGLPQPRDREPFRARATSQCILESNAHLRQAFGLGGGWIRRHCHRKTSLTRFRRRSARYLLVGRAAQNPQRSRVGARIGIAVA